MAQTVHGRSGVSGRRWTSGMPFNIKNWRKCWENQWNYWLAGQMVNQQCCLEVLAKLQKWVRKKMPELWKKKWWILPQGNVPAHSGLAVKQFLANKCIPALESDLAPCDVYLLPKLKSALKGTHFLPSMRWKTEQGVSWWPAELLWTLEKSYAAVYRWEGGVSVHWRG
jgi:hypothetical protein